MGEQKTSKKAGIVLFSNILTAINQAVILIVLARVLEKAILGDVFKLIMIYTTAVLIGNFGFSDNPYYFVPKLPPASHGRFLSQCMRILGITGLVAGCLSFLVFLYFFGNPLIGAIFIGVITLELATSITPDFLVATGRAAASALFNVVLSLIRVFVIIGICLYATDVILALAYGFLAVAMIRLIFSLLLNRTVLTRDQGPLPPGFLKQQLDFGIPLGFANLTMRINKQVDNYVVAFYFSSSMFAEYTVGSWEIPMILKIPYSITAVYMSQYTRLYDENRIAELHQQWLKVSEKIILLLVPITMFFLIFAGEFIHVVFGEQFTDAVIVFQIFTVTLFTRVSSYSGLLKSLGESRFVLTNSLLLVTLNLVFNILFVWLLGLYGAPIGTLLANLVALAVSLRKISSVIRVPISRLMPYGFHLKVTGVSFVTAIAVYYSLRGVLSSDGWMLGSSAIAYLAGFVILGSVLKIITRTDREFVKSLVLPTRPLPRMEG